eukprot:PhM_4_TR18475/c1_g1_i2/m.21205
MYNINVTVKDTLTSKTGCTSVSFSPRRPPSSGGLSVSRQFGDALGYNELSAPSWIAEDADALPLTYQFHLLEEDGGIVVLSDRTPSPTVTVRLPQSECGEAILMYSVSVTDVFGESATLEAPCIISRAPDEAVLNLTRNATSDLNVLSRTSDIGGALEILTVVSSTTKGSNSTTNDTTLFDSALNSMGGSVNSTTGETDVNTTVSFVREDHVSQVTFVVSEMSASLETSALANRTDAVTSLLNGTLEATKNSGNKLSDNDAARLLTSASSMSVAISATQSTSKTDSARRRRRGSDDGATLVDDAQVRRNINFVDAVSSAVMRSTVESESVTVSTPGMSLGCTNPSGGGGDDALSVGGTTAGLDGASGTQQPVRLCTASWPTNIFKGLDTTGESANVSSNVVSISLRSRETDGAVHRVNITFTLPYDTTKTRDADSEPTCSFFDFSRQTYSTDGCVTVQRNADHIVCRCLHLTDFAAIDRAKSVQLEPKIYLDIGNFADIKVGGIIYISVLTGVFVFMAALGYWYGQRRQKKLVEAYYRVLKRFSER